jgi:hypothetical protein
MIVVSFIYNSLTYSHLRNGAWGVANHEHRRMQSWICVRQPPLLPLKYVPCSTSLKNKKKWLKELSKVVNNTFLAQSEIYVDLAFLPIHNLTPRLACLRISLHHHEVYFLTAAHLQPSSCYSTSLCRSVHIECISLPSR